jgi:hypothetical protein
MQAIVVKYIPAAPVKGSRYKATASAGSITMYANDSLSIEGNRDAVAIALCKKLGWSPTWSDRQLVRGGLPKSSDTVYVFDVPSERVTF